ncbi:MAG: hypothetical protein AUH30_06480 [Candidatus Rokubacteria bacterium 13_1_40CM_68_15]|nr:MAG: hypothetical protein AUH30_06480 [Candidatus Rokubacteria bacterium 13_1_40CM_68_15]
MPLTLIALVILSGLMIAFAVLAQSEPVIAANQYRGAVARALAESAVERAVWALTAGSGVSGGIGPPSNGVVAGPPYDGGTYITIGAGGFTLKITGVSMSEAKIEAVGSTPSNTSTGSAHRKITATLMRFPNFGLDAPCALCVKGDLEVKGSSTIDARGDTSCGRKYGAYTAGTTMTLDAASIWGATDGNDTGNETTDVVINAPTSDFDAFTLGAHHLAVLKQMARTSGTYIGPGSPPAGGASWTGAATFNASNPITRNGIVFVDTISGNPPAASNPDDYANVDFQGTPFSMGDFHGWIIVMGNVIGINASGAIRGLLYVVNDVTSNGGSTPVNGLVIAQNLNASNGSQTDATVSFNCANANGAGKVPTGWFLTAGSYKEVSGH